MHPFGDFLEWYELETAQEAIMALNSAFSEQRSLAPFFKALTGKQQHQCSIKEVHIYSITRYCSRCFSI